MIEKQLGCLPEGPTCRWSVFQIHTEKKQENSSNYPAPLIFQSVSNHSELTCTVYVCACLVYLLSQSVSDCYLFLSSSSCTTQRKKVFQVPPLWRKMSLKISCFATRPKSIQSTTHKIVPIKRLLRGRKVHQRWVTLGGRCGVNVRPIRKEFSLYAAAVCQKVTTTF